MPLPNALDPSDCKPGLPTGVDDQPAAKFPDRVEIGGVEYPCRVTRAIGASRRDEMDTEFGRVAFVVRFPARPAGVAVNTPILWTVDDGVAMDPRYVLIAMIGVLRPDENDSYFAVPCEWKGGEEPLTIGG